MKYIHDLVSIVLIGSQNPQILTHDFLISNSIIPKEEEPFKTVIDKNPNTHCSNFISSPPFSTIAYDNISITIQENMFQITDNSKEIMKTPIIEIVKKYFGEVLIHTPLKVGGFNLQGHIESETIEELNNLSKKIGFNITTLEKKFGNSLNIGSVFSIPWKNGTIEVRLPYKNNKILNVNYEFQFQNDFGESLSNLDNIEDMISFRDEILNFIEVK